MKNKIYLFAICSAAFLYSCSGSMNPAKMFSKKWQFESAKGKALDDEMARIATIQKSMDTIKDSATKVMMKQSVDMANAGMDAMKSMVLTCNGDGTCETSATVMGQQSTSKGKWALIADGKKVVITEEKNPKPDTMDIVELTADHMTVSGPDGRGGTVSMTYKSVQ